MGCKGSKDTKEDKKISGDFERVEIVKFDEFFDNASQLLNNAEKIRSGLDDNREKAAEITHAHLLKDPKYVDNVQVLFWTLSADANGKVVDTGVTVVNDSPYIQLDKHKVTADTFNLYQVFTDYVKTVTEGPETIKDIIAKLEEMSKALPELGTEAKAEIQASSLSMVDKAKAIAKIGKNSAKLPKELKKCQALSELLKQAVTDMKELVPQLSGLLAKADEVGAKAAAENVKKPAEIFEKYHAGARKIEKKAEKAAKKEEKKEAKAEKKEEKKEEKIEKQIEKQIDKIEKQVEKAEEKAEKKEEQAEKKEEHAEKKEEHAEKKEEHAEEHAVAQEKHEEVTHWRE